MSVIRVNRGPDANPWLFHARTVEEVDAHLRDMPSRERVEGLADQLLDLRIKLRNLEAS